MTDRPSKGAYRMKILVIGAVAAGTSAAAMQVISSKSKANDILIAPPKLSCALLYPFESTLIMKSRGRPVNDLMIAFLSFDTIYKMPDK